MMPLPPGYKIMPEQPRADEPIKQAEIPTRKFQSEGDRDKTVNETDINFILTKYLQPHHRSDPNVMAFIKEYLLCRDSKQAAHTVGLTTADGRNLRLRPDIHNAIVAITDLALHKHGYDASEIIQKVKEIVEFDPIDLEREGGGYKSSMKEIPPEARRALRKLSVKNTYLYDANNMPQRDSNGRHIVETEIISYEFYDKIKGSELLGREKNIFKESKILTHDISQNMSNTLLESRERAEARKLEMREVKEISYTPPPTEVIDLEKEIEDESDK